MEKSRKYEKNCAAYLIYVYIKSVFAFARIFTLVIGIYILLYKYEECLITVSSLYNSVYNKNPLFLEMLYIILNSKYKVYLNVLLKYVFFGHPICYALK